MRLYDAAFVCRSKNAGPFQVTVDLMFKDLQMYEKVLNNIKTYCIIKTEQQCISLLAKGMASRHLFTHIYRIHYTSPTKASLRNFCLTDLLRSV